MLCFIPVTFSQPPETFQEILLQLGGQDTSENRLSLLSRWVNGTLKGNIMEYPPVSQVSHKTDNQTSRLYNYISISPKVAQQIL